MSIYLSIAVACSEDAAGNPLTISSATIFARLVCYLSL